MSSEIKVFTEIYKSKSLPLKEDGAFYDQEHGLYALVDSFGAPQPELFLKDLSSTITNSYLHMWGDENATRPVKNLKHLTLEGNALYNAICFYHRLLYKKNAQSTQGRSGAAGAFLALSDDIVTAYNVGSTSIWRIHPNGVEPVCSANKLADKLFSGSYSIPGSGLGLFEDLFLDIRQIHLGQDEIFIIMNSGLGSFVNYNDLRVIQKTKLPLDQFGHYLVNLALERGSQDHLSVMLLST